MSESFELTVEARSELGKSKSRRMRREANTVPAVVFGAGKPSQPIMINHNHIMNALKNEAYYSHILTLNLGGAQEKVVLKALQRHPSKPQILHADFQRVSMHEKLTMHIPLHFTHEDIAPGVKVDGGVVSHMMSEVEVRCLPADLPEFIEVDLSELKLNESVHLSQLKVGKGVELVALMHEDDRMVASLHMPHVIEEPEEIEVPSAEVPLVGEEEAAAAGEAPAAEAEGEKKSKE